MKALIKIFGVLSIALLLVSILGVIYLFTNPLNSIIYMKYLLLCLLLFEFSIITYIIAKTSRLKNFLTFSLIAIGATQILMYCSGLMFKDFLLMVYPLIFSVAVFYISFGFIGLLNGLHPQKSNRRIQNIGVLLIGLACTATILFILLKPDFEGAKNVLLFSWAGVSILFLVILFKQRNYK